MATTAILDVEAADIADLVKERRFGVSLPVLIVGVVILFSFLLTPRTVSDPDIWWHLQDAKLQVASHSFLRHDSYSFTARGAPWMNHEWLAEMPFLLGYTEGGLTGLYLAMVISIATVMLGILHLAWRASGSVKAAVLAGLPAIILSSVSFGPRTLLFGWMLLLVELNLLQKFSRAESRQIWWMPALFAVWVNAHGSWIIGLVLFTLFALSGLVEFSSGGLYSRRWSRAQLVTLFKAGIASVAALFCNPYGWRLVLYPFNLAFHQKLNIENVEEWRSVDFHLFRGKVFLALIAVMILFRLLQRTRWSLQEAAFVLVAFYSGLTYSRFMFLAAILVTPLLARDLTAWIPYRPERGKRLFNAIALGIVGYILFIHLPSPRQIAHQPAYPVTAVRYLQQNPLQGATFNEYLWGGYLELNAPAIPTYIDSRMDIFEYNGTLRDYLNIVHLEDSLTLLDKYQIQNVLIPTKSSLSYLLTHASRWRLAYQDDVAVLFIRN